MLFEGTGAKKLFENEVYPDGSLVRGTGYTEYLYSKHKKLQEKTGLSEDVQTNWSLFNRIVDKSTFGVD